MFAANATMRTFAPLLCRMLRLTLSAFTDTQLYCKFDGEGGELMVLLMPDQCQIRFSAFHTYLTYPSGVVLNGLTWKHGKDLRVCGTEQVGRIFMLLNEKLTGILTRSPHLKMTGKVPSSFATLPKILSFLSIFTWIAFLGKGTLVRCPGKDADLVLFDVPVTVRISPGECPFVLEWSSLKVVKELRPDLQISFYAGDQLGVSVESDISMDSLVLYILWNIQRVVREHR